MATIQFILDKIPAKLNEDKVYYYFPNHSDAILANDFIGNKLSLKFTGKLFCLDCGKEVKKFYGQGGGLCYVCTMSSPLNSECIVRPELCEAHLGGGKVPEWEQRHHNQPHIVYLANSGGLKVGVTRADQIPTRWIDQGADEAIVLARTPYRQLAGQIEYALKDYISDKTNWRNMLKNVVDTSVNLHTMKDKYAAMLDVMGGGMSDYISEDDTKYKLQYPTQIIEGSIQSLKLDKTPTVEGILTGIKGQYLIFDNRYVLNMRSHGGYEVEIVTE